jgi:hypothetical protein
MDYNVVDLNNDLYKLLTPQMFCNMYENHLTKPLTYWIYEELAIYMAQHALTNVRNALEMCISTGMFYMESDNHEGLAQYFDDWAMEFYKRLIKHNKIYGIQVMSIFVELINVKFREDCPADPELWDDWLTAVYALDKSPFNCIVQLCNLTPDWSLDDGHSPLLDLLARITEFVKRQNIIAPWR